MPAIAGVKRPRLFAPGMHGIRMDQAGDGTFGARRDGGLRGHRGVDYVVPVGGIVWSPCTGRVGQYGYCYPDDYSFRFVRIHTEWAEVRVLYVDPRVFGGEMVEPGQILGEAQNIAGRYGPLMTNHVHLEVRPVRGVRIGSDGHRPNDIVTIDPTWFM